MWPQAVFFQYLPCDPYLCTGEEWGDLGSLSGHKFPPSEPAYLWNVRCRLGVLLGTFQPKMLSVNICLSQHKPKSIWIVWSDTYLWAWQYEEVCNEQNSTSMHSGHSMKTDSSTPRLLLDSFHLYCLVFLVISPSPLPLKLISLPTLFLL